MMDSRDVQGSKVQRMWMALNMYIGKYSDPFKGKTKDCSWGLDEFKTPLQGTCLMDGSVFRLKSLDEIFHHTLLNT